MWQLEHTHTHTHTHTRQGLTEVVASPCHPPSTKAKETQVTAATIPTGPCPMGLGGGRRHFLEACFNGMWQGQRRSYRAPLVT